MKAAAVCSAPANLLDRLMSMAPAPGPMHSEPFAVERSSPARFGMPQDPIAEQPPLHTISYAAGVWTGKRHLLDSFQDGAAHAPAAGQTVLLAHPPHKPAKSLQHKPMHAPAPAPHAHHTAREHMLAAERTLEAAPKLGREPHVLSAKGAVRIRLWP